MARLWITAITVELGVRKQSRCVERGGGRRTDTVTQQPSIDPELDAEGGRDAPDDKRLPRIHRRDPSNSVSQGEPQKMAG